MSNSDYVLFYSNRCLHCKELITLLSKDVNLNQKFTKVNIDNANIKIPPYVKSVPTAIVSANGQPSLLVGSQIFNWYNQSHSKTVESQGILDWDPHTMTGYSDGFSYLSEKPDVMKKSFSFISDNDSITTPDEKNYSGEKSERDQPKTELDNDYEKHMNQRKFEVPVSMPRL